MLDRLDEDARGRAGETSRPAPTLVRLTSSQAGAAHGTPLVLRAQVRTLAGPAAAAGGRVLFRAADRALGVAGLGEGGVAVLGGVLLPPGVHALTASYGGDARHAGACSPPLPQAVTVAAAPVVVLVDAPADGPDGVLLQAQLVDPQTGRPAEAATGSLVFTAGSTDLARAELVAGHARAVVQRLPPGRLRAAFAGDPEHAPATGTYAPR